MNIDRQCCESAGMDSDRSMRLEMPSGMLGFETVKAFVLEADPLEAPLMWLRAEGEPDLAFLVISPSLILSDYHPDIADNDVDCLGLDRPDQALVLNVVTVRNSGPATVNLKGPIVVNRETKRARQVIPLNAAAFNLRHPLPELSPATPCSS